MLLTKTCKHFLLMKKRWFTLLVVAKENRTAQYQTHTHLAFLTWTLMYSLLSMSAYLLISRWMSPWISWSLSGGLILNHFSTPEWCTTMSHSSQTDITYHWFWKICVPPAPTVKPDAQYPTNWTQFHPIRSNHFLYSLIWFIACRVE